MRVIVSSALALWMTLVSSPVIGVSYGQGSPAQSSTAPTTKRVVAASRATTVFGYVWDAKNNPVSHATLRLRNVTSGKVGATTSTAANGEFTFENVEAGTYAIECVDDAGKILAVGQVFSVAQGETVATFIRLEAHVPWFAALFGNAGAAVVASAAALGVTAVAPPSRPVSPEG